MRSCRFVLLPIFLSCWAFSVTETTESAIAIANNNTLVNTLSPQQIVDCDWFNGNQGCNGQRRRDATIAAVSIGRMYVRHHVC